MRCKRCGAKTVVYSLCKNCREEESFLYELKPSLVTDAEMEYLECIRELLPEGCLIQPQANLASFIRRTDGAKYQNELFRNVDFIVTDEEYCPLFLIEINDRSHLEDSRRQRDRKVSEICEEAGIPLITLWMSYGINRNYIEKRIWETLDSLPVERIHHFVKEEPKKGCYIATCVYGSYDCPQVWLLRRFRDEVLEQTWGGRMFIRCYYAVSPSLVKRFEHAPAVVSFCRKRLDALVFALWKRGISSAPYKDNEEVWKNNADIG